MGMDVHGLNPKQNKAIDKFPVMKKYDAMEFSKKWKELDKNEKLRTKYWKEVSDFEDVNVGHYFRNNVWWWRPLWNYCHVVAGDIIIGNLRVKKFKDDENGDTNYDDYEWVKAEYDEGHGNSGASLNSRNAKLLGNRLMEHIADGRTIEYQAEYEQYLNDLPDDDCGVCNGNNRGNTKKKDCNRCNGTGKTKSFNKSYPFDVENVEAFALFCIESGGFEIC